MQFLLINEANVSLKLSHCFAKSFYKLYKTTIITITDPKKIKTMGAVYDFPVKTPGPRSTKFGPDWLC